ncbi:MAG: 3-phosphoserine/phosphohydroxythreonine transaminase [Verrucomicrobia bacterium]|nr:MAG: 3-phosphoserine/phosphohydroxythreonine transaminase [Verrucomicrobiota bacterium]
MARVYNFNPGPATLPVEVLRQVQEELLDYHGSGMSIMESSHRGPEYNAVHEEAVANIRKLLNIPEEYAVLFMTGGASVQFALVPMNLAGKGAAADYVNSGYWAEKAIKEARLQCTVNVIADTAGSSPARLPDPESIQGTPGAAYLHITSNETIAGTQWKAFPRVETPLVADMSSDILSRPLDVSRFGIIYAGAQKNLGPAGVTVVIIRKDLAERVSEDVPIIFRYRTHIEKNSLYNTPPCFNIYVVMLVTRWLLSQGGLGAIAQRNERKARLLYEVIDGSEFYRGTADPAYRSVMNVTFRLPSEELEKLFVREAAEQGMKGLKGHRSVGGIRASIYNAFPIEGVETLAAFMREFESRHG